MQDPELKGQNDVGVIKQNAHDLVSMTHLLGESIVRFLDAPSLISWMLTSVEILEIIDNPRNWQLMFSKTFGPKKICLKHARRGIRKRKGKKNCSAKNRFSMLWKEEITCLARGVGQEYAKEASQLEWEVVLAQTRALLTSLDERGLATQSSTQKACDHASLAIWPRAVYEKKKPQCELNRAFYCACSKCGMAPVLGACYRCLLCENKCNLCQDCYSIRSDHHPPHPFIALPSRDQRTQSGMVRIGSQECGCPQCYVGCVIDVYSQKLGPNPRSFAKKHAKNSWAINDKEKDLERQQLTASFVPLKVQCICLMTPSRIRSKLKTSHKNTF